MRRLAHLLIAIFFVTGFSCSRYCCDVPQPMNTMQATKNGTAWTISPIIARTYLDSLSIADTSVSGTHSELIVFKLNYTGTGKYALAQNNVNYGYLSGMDAPYVYYSLDSSYGNSLNVTAYDAVNHIIVGTFNMKLLKDPANSDLLYPAAISFLNGSFRAQLSK